MTAARTTALMVAFPEVGALLEQHAAEPGVVADRLRRHLALVAETLQSSGAVVGECAPSGLPAIFPAAAGTSAQRAVAAASALVGANERLNLSEPAQRLSVAIGIAAGPVTLRTGAAQAFEPCFLGDCVYIASILAAHAGPNEIVMAEEVHESVAEALRAQPNRPRTVLGRENPIASYTLRPAVLSHLGEPPES